MIRPFTGRHMTVILIAFFGIVVAVNFTMARLAIGTFGGTVVDNSYVASQKFNGWLAEARAQRGLGWTATAALDADRHVILTVDQAGSAHASGTARHPLGRATDIPVTFVPTGEDQLRSTAALPPGRWRLHVSVSRGGRDLRLIEAVR
jgi:nitrogen fixation protein FixH